MLKYLVFLASLFTTFIFILIDSVLGHLIYFSSSTNIIDCPRHTPHTRTFNLLCLIYFDLTLNLDLSYQATKIGGVDLP
jgi:hypothetical protein